MAITKLQMTQAFSVFKNASVPAERVEVDLGKVASTLLTELGDAVSSEDPEAAFAELEKSVEDIEAILEKGEVDEEADSVYVSKAVAGDSFEFAVGESQAPAADVDSAEADPAPEPTAKSQDDADEDLDLIDEDDGSWGEDLSPKTPPTMRSARLTKRERAGGRKTQEKYKRSRERAMERRQARGN